MIIKIILIVSIFTILIKLLTARNAARTQASKKLFLIGMIVGALISVLWPETTNWIAKKVGVGRGADLMLYALLVAFIFLIVNNYIKSKEEKRNLVKIVRKLSILEARLEKVDRSTD